MTESLAPPTPIGPGPQQRSFQERLMGALRLDSATYEEVVHDEEALNQAVGVVALSTLAEAVHYAGAGKLTLLGILAAPLVAWLASAGIVWLASARFVNRRRRYSELLRAIGFAEAPQIALVLSVVPGFVLFLPELVLVWNLLAYIVAVRRALDLDTLVAARICLPAFMVGKFAFILALVFGYHSA